MKRRKFINYTAFVVGGLSCGSLFGFNSIRHVRIGIITDLHYAPKGPQSDNNRHYNESLEKLDEFIVVMNEQKADFIIELGDFKDQDNIPDEKNTLKYLKEVEHAFKQFKGPAYHVLGNHDHDSISKQQFLDNITNSCQEKARNYYSFDINGFHFVVLDANYLSNREAYNRGNFDWRDSYIPEFQIEWLKEDLSNAKNPVVIFVHQRLDISENNRAFCVKNALEIQNVINDSRKVVLVVQGHHHEGDYNRIKGIGYFTMKAAVEGSGLHNNNYGILEIDSDIMKLTGYRKTESQDL